ncbi:MAG: ribosome small subunit-dependent GTPase A [Bryobacteraceae bacterium]
MQRELGAVERKQRVQELKARKAPVKRPATGEGGERGVVAAIFGPTCLIWSGEEDVTCRPLPGLAVGDRVVFSRAREAVVEVEPRTSKLSRPDPGNPRRERIIAANVDVLVIVTTLRSPEFRPGLVDRYLVAASSGGARPVICVNKVDLLESPAELRQLDAYRGLGVPVVPCSAATGAGLELLLEYLRGSQCVLAGHSGVGKSSLLNALVPGLELAVSAISEAHGKGRHTTSAASLHRLENGAIVIDTPGVREFGLWNAGLDEVRRGFPEFDALACRFRGCSHIEEPGCEVRRATEEGRIDGRRYDAYRRLAGEAVNR